MPENHPSKSLMTRFLIWAVTWWRHWISPFYSRWGVCRYTPSCSTYALQALNIWGWRKGGWLAICRLARCNPFHTCGYDPVPQPSNQ